MWIGVLQAGLRVAMWITHVGGKFCHGLLEKSRHQNQSRSRKNLRDGFLAGMDSSRIFMCELPEFFVDFVAGVFHLIL